MYSLTVHPNTAFPALAEAIRRCCPIWQIAQVLFLLDDVSTRYLNQPRIEELLSALMFQSPSCAFKLTSEAQTIELGLKSPGGIHLARVGRDLSVFDLGAEVYEKIKRPGEGNGRDFVEEILKQRARHFVAHPDVAPGVLLDDVPLETIAVEIGESASSSRRRKEIYRGITAAAPPSDRGAARSASRPVDGRRRAGVVVLQRPGQPLDRHPATPCRQTCPVRRQSARHQVAEQAGRQPSRRPSTCFRPCVSSPNAINRSCSQESCGTTSSDCHEGPVGVFPGLLRQATL